MTILTTPSTQTTFRPLFPPTLIDDVLARARNVLLDKLKTRNIPADVTNLVYDVEYLDVIKEWPPEQWYNGPDGLDQEITACLSRIAWAIAQ